MRKQLVVFTDLDGTLLDHHNYSWSAAAKTLNTLKGLGVAVIPNTSKTFAELLPLRQELELDTPFIVENGAAVNIPHGFFPAKPTETVWQQDYWVRAFSMTKNHWIALLNQLPEDFAEMYQGFSQMSVQEIVAATGLSEDKAQQASQRQYGEPLLWKGTDLDKASFYQAMAAKGVNPVEGGRFVHIGGDNDKGAAMAWFMREYQRQYSEYHCISVALGDGQNDLAMLEAADLSVCIRSPSHSGLSLSKKQDVFFSQHYGPAGWSEVMEQIINRYY